MGILPWPRRPLPVELVLGDICRQDVDAIVNAADQTLLGGTGVDGAIREAAGPELSVACRLLGGLQDKPKATAGYQLPAKWVVHAAAPVWISSLKPKDLATTFYDCIEIADALGARSIAFPLLGAGAFGWPSDQVAEAARLGIRKGLKRHRGVAFVRIVAFFRSDLEAIEAEFGIQGREEPDRRVYHPGAT